MDFTEGQNVYDLESLLFKLVNELNPVESRKLAGLKLKDAFDATEFPWQWLSLNFDLRYQIIEDLLRTLQSQSQDCQSIASQLVAKLVGFQLHSQEFPRLLHSLFVRTYSGKVSYVTALETLGYLCKEVYPDCMDQIQVNEILQPIILGMSKSVNNDVRLAATRALCNAVEFAKLKFSSDLERTIIMNAVIGATTSQELQIQQAAFEFLVSISSTCYENLGTHIKDIFHRTETAVRTGEEAVALQAIEFWSSICDKEIAGPCFNFIKMVLPNLVIMLLNNLFIQKDDQNDDKRAWSIAMACRTCLGLVALAVGEEIINLIIPLFEKDFGEDWRLKRAYYYAYGSMLEAMSAEKWTDTVTTYLDSALGEHNHLMDAVVWFLGRICKVLLSTVQGRRAIKDSGPRMMKILVQSMMLAPNVAEEGCYVLYILACSEDWGDESPLADSFQDIVCLLCYLISKEVTEEPLAAAYETLNVIVRCLTKENTSLLIIVADCITMKLENTLKGQMLSYEEREKQGKLGILCGCVQVIIQKLPDMKDLQTGEKDQYLDKMMKLLLAVSDYGSATVHKEAMLAIGALAHTTSDPYFEKHMVKCQKYIEMGLQNFEEYHVCAVTVGFVTDICSALEDAAESVEQKYGADEAQYKNAMRNGILDTYSKLLQGFKNSRETHPLTPNAPHIFQFLNIMYIKGDMDDLVKKTAIGVLGDLACTLGSNAGYLFLKYSKLRTGFLDECLHLVDESIKETAEWTNLAIETCIKTM